MAEFLKSKLPKSSQTKSKSFFYSWLNKVMFILDKLSTIQIVAFLYCYTPSIDTSTDTKTQKKGPTLY